MLCHVGLQVGQRVVYSILKELLNYPRVAKPLDYKKKATTLFPKVKQLVQHLQSEVMEEKTIWKCITLVVALDLLHNDFKMKTAPRLYSGDKYLKQIQQIVTSIEVAKLAKRMVGASTELVMMAKKKHSAKQHATKFKVNKECFNYRRKGYYTKNCHFSNKKKPKKSAEEAKCTW